MSLITDMDGEKWISQYHLMDFAFPNPSISAINPKLRRRLWEKHFISNELKK